MTFRVSSLDVCSSLTSSSTPDLLFYQASSFVVGPVSYVSTALMHFLLVPPVFD